jgi:hypothetical protein
MSKSGQNYLLSEVRKSVEYCAREYEMTWAEAVGCLDMIKHYYIDMAFSINIEEDIIEEEDDDIQDQ